jgi:hypothetical protein
MTYNKPGSGFYSPVGYRSDYYIQAAGMACGIGVQGSSGYLMIYYRDDLQ